MKLEQTKNESFYSVWVGGVEVNDYPLSKKQAENLQKLYKEDGYTDTAIEKLENDLSKA